MEKNCIWICRKAYYLHSKLGKGPIFSTIPVMLKCLLNQPIYWLNVDQIKQYLVEENFAPESIRIAESLDMNSEFLVSKRGSQSDQITFKTISHFWISQFIFQKYSAKFQSSYLVFITQPFAKTKNVFANHRRLLKYTEHWRSKGSLRYR